MSHYGVLHIHLLYALVCGVAQVSFVKYARSQRLLLRTLRKRSALRRKLLAKEVRGSCMCVEKYGLVGSQSSS